MAVWREADTKNALSLEGPWLQGFPGAKQEDGNSNGNFGRIAAGPMSGVEENLAELVSVLFRGPKKADGSWDGQMHRT